MWVALTWPAPGSPMLSVWPLARVWGCDPLSECQSRAQVPMVTRGAERWDQASVSRPVGVSGEHIWDKSYKNKVITKIQLGWAGVQGQVEGSG